MITYHKNYINFIRGWLWILQKVGILSMKKDAYNLLFHIGLG